MLYLALAAFWLGLAAFFLIVQPEWGNLFVVSPGWFALVLMAYNLVRWMSLRRLAEGRRRSEERWAEAREEMRRRRSEVSEPDPNFQFTHPPPQEPRS
jgi:hypothetical protein